MTKHLVFFIILVLLKSVVFFCFSIKPFTQQPYPIQPTVTTAISSENLHDYTVKHAPFILVVNKHAPVCNMSSKDEIFIIYDITFYFMIIYSNIGFS